MFGWRWTRNGRPLVDEQEQESGGKVSFFHQMSSEGGITFFCCYRIKGHERIRESGAVFSPPTLFRLYVHARATNLELMKQSIIQSVIPQNTWLHIGKSPIHLLFSNQHRHPTGEGRRCVGGFSCCWSGDCGIFPKSFKFPFYFSFFYW